ncbi:MAG: 3-phosphoshikimate 1-carboxyvinyltransferase [Melioribacteraceae bacterium]|nr:3-phosphoshikimate 1-carboxyvinyltransferase [Melioribacteraceae bacterium]
MKQSFSKINKVEGELTFRGDKSISHRSVIFSALSEGKSIIKNLSNSDDVASTIGCFKELGAEFNFLNDELEVVGKGINSFNAPSKQLDAGNSGTTARLLSGILSAQNFDSELIGDESLSKRPMSRVANPLRTMGAKITLADDNFLPMKISNTSLHPIEYEMEIASAQIKSALLLAAIHLPQESKIIEKLITRDHTERMLRLPTYYEAGKKIISAAQLNYPKKSIYNVPGDISSASFFIVLALLAKDSELVIRNCSLNESRIGIIEVLQKMGGDITIISQSSNMGEPVGDLLIRSTEQLTNIKLDERIIPNIIDELPILSIAGIFADGDFEVRNAKELRVKETDRINAVCRNMERAGINVTEFEDGFRFSGSPKSQSNIFESFGDHRIAMSFSILGMLLENETIINDFESVSISNPLFLEQIAKILN